MTRCLLFGAFLLVAGSARAAPAKPPNLVLLITDDQRFDALGAAGNPHVQTPHLDALAQAGCYFVQAIAHVSQCAPSRATMLSGQPVFRHQHLSNTHQPGNRAGQVRSTTVVEHLAAAGYHTMLVGKWHLWGRPWKLGFVEVGTWLPLGATRYVTPALAEGRSVQQEPCEGYTQEILVDRALERVQAAAAAGTPWFLWLGLTAPHSPFFPAPARHRMAYAGRDPAQLAPPLRAGEPAAADWPLYYSAVTHLDAEIGRFRGGLEKLGLADDTVVLVVSDNGLMMGTREVDGKVVPYEESVRVPFLVTGPGVAPRRCHLPVSTLDVAPTLLGLAGLEVPATWPGQDLTEVLGGGALAREFTLAEYQGGPAADGSDPAFRLLRSADWKLILWRDAEKDAELYHLRADPRERHNLFAAGAVSPVAAPHDALRTALDRWLEETGDPASGWSSVRALREVGG